MKTWNRAILGCLIALVPAGPALAATRACDSIHAVQIALEEGLGDCDTTVMGALVGRSSGGPLADLADPVWHADCVGLTANACAALHAAHPERTVTAHGGDMTLVFPDTEERCADGTRPAYYFAPGSGTDANKWVVYLNGNSGRCGARVDRAGGVIVPLGESCFERFAAGDADSAFLLNAAKNEDGIMSAAPANPFSTWNRVHIPSCSNDQYQGQRIHHGVAVTQVGADVYTADVYSRGHVIVKEVLTDLALHHGLATSETIVLHGASGGAGGLIFTLDALADFARGLTATPVAVVALIDSRGAEPGSDNSEARFDDLVTTCPSIYAADCAGLGFDVPPAGTDLAGFAFDLSAYQPYSALHPTGGGVYEKLLSWRSVKDADCESVHGTNAPQCFDVDHVLFNHLGTPVFIAASISDLNQWNNPIEFLGELQPDISWQVLDCGGSPGRHYIEHARNQLAAYMRNRDNAVGGADGASNGSGTMGVWAPQIWDHVMAHDDCKFGALTVGGVTLSSAFSGWLAGNTVKLIDGVKGNRTGRECGTPVPPCLP